jgi:ubiquinone/menaquinone biosynthesis C-methylase UbiE
METINIAALALPNQNLILDLGCGEGRHGHACAWHYPDATIFCVDLNTADLTTARSRGKCFFESHNQHPTLAYCCSDGTKLPFVDATFDTVICSEVLEHITDYPIMLAEIFRVLKPGGCLAVSVPRAWPERLCWWLSDAYHNVEGGHLRIFNAQKLSQNIVSLGFIQTHSYYAHALHSFYWWLRCWLWQRGENTWLCRTYHRLLVWDLLYKPRCTRILEKILNPVMGKSIVWHFTKKSDTVFNSDNLAPQRFLNKGTF